MNNAKMRDLTGKIGRNKLDCLFYLLLRDHVTAGTMEYIIDALEDGLDDKIELPMVISHSIVNY